MRYNMHTHRHDLSAYCSHFYGSSISLLLPFVLRIISLHEMGGILAVSFSLHPMHVSNFPFLSFFLPFFFPSFSLNLIIRTFGGHSAVMAVQTGGPKPLRYFFNLIAGFPLLSFLCVLPSPLSLFSLTLSLYYPGVWQAEPRWIALFYLHCASGWHCELDLGYSQVHVCVCISLLASIIMLQFMNLKLVWLYPPQSASHKFLPPWCRNKIFPNKGLYIESKPI